MNELNQKINIAGLAEESVVDGLGIRFTLFVQGCPHRCEDCHNPATHSYIGGKEYTLAELSDLVKKNSLLDGVTYSGGEPFLFSKELKNFSRYIHSLGLNIWCYTGYTFEELKQMSKTDTDILEMLEGIDVLVDGRFEKSKKNLLLKFRGSENQRVINLKAMRESGKNDIVELFI